MTTVTTIRDAAVAVLVVAVGALIRTVWNLASRVSRIEGRLNGRREE